MSGFEVNQFMVHFNSNNISLIRILPRMRQDQKIQISFNKVEIPSFLLQPIAIFSGNLYLNNEEEQSAFLNFIGYRPSPRTPEEDVFFQRGEINKNGYVPTHFRVNFHELSQLCKFKDDPNELIKRIIEIRNYAVVPNSAHHYKIFLSGKKPLM